MIQRDPDTEELIDRAARGDRSARCQLLERHTERLQRMVELHFDPRLAPRLDPSDVVQEALAEADRRFPEYLKGRPFPQSGRYARNPTSKNSLQNAKNFRSKSL